MSSKIDPATGYEVDEYETVLPTTETAIVVAMNALNGGCIVNLFLGDMTSMNVLFVVTKYGKPKDSYRVKDLTVGVDRLGLYQFNIPRTGELHPNYIEEKLNLSGKNAEVLAKFIEEVSQFIEISIKLKHKKLKGITEV